MSINKIKMRLKQHSLYETNTLKNINEEQQHSPEQNREAMYSSDLEFSSGVHKGKHSLNWSGNV